MNSNHDLNPQQEQLQSPTYDNSVGSYSAFPFAALLLLLPLLLLLAYAGRKSHGRVVNTCDVSLPH